MRYKVLRMHSAQDLTIEVNKAIQDGWRPQGGVCMVIENGAEWPLHYIQAIVFDEPKDEPTKSTFYEWEKDA